MIYLASPYSHPNPVIRWQRFHNACMAAGKLMCEGAVIFSPIAHTHPIAEMCALPLGFDYWEKFDREMIGYAAKLLVLKLPGWDESKGVAAEIKIAEEMGIPIEYMEWE